MSIETLLWPEILDYTVLDINIETLNSQASLTSLTDTIMLKKIVITIHRYLDLKPLVLLSNREMILVGVQSWAPVNFDLSCTQSIIYPGP